MTESLYPRLPPATGADSIGALQRYLYEFSVRLVGFFKTLPDTEHKRVATTGVFPVFVSTRIANPVEVRRCQTYKTADSASTISDVSIAWQRSSDPNQPGVMITDMGGLTVDTQYTVVVAIEGTRS